MLAKFFFRTQSGSELFHFGAASLLKVVNIYFKKLGIFDSLFQVCFEQCAQRFVYKKICQLSVCNVRMSVSCQCALCAYVCQLSMCTVRICLSAVNVQCAHVCQLSMCTVRMCLSAVNVQCAHVCQLSMCTVRIYLSAVNVHCAHMSVSQPV